MLRRTPGHTRSEQPVSTSVLDRQLTRGVPSASPLATMRIQEVGQGPPILFAHGVSVTGSTWTTGRESHRRCRLSPSEPISASAASNRRTRRTHATGRSGSSRILSRCVSLVQVGPAGRQVLGHVGIRIGAADDGGGQPAAPDRLPDGSGVGVEATSDGIDAPPRPEMGFENVDDGFVEWVRLDPVIRFRSCAEIASSVVSTGWGGRVVA